VPKPGNTVVIAAAVIAAILLAREDKILNTPKVVATIGDSLSLARQNLRPRGEGVSGSCSAGSDGPGILAYHLWCAALVPACQAWTFVSH
jgi:hypothetical protein